MRPTEPLVAAPPHLVVATIGAGACLAVLVTGRGIGVGSMAVALTAAAMVLVVIRFGWRCGTCGPGPATSITAQRAAEVDAFQRHSLPLDQFLT